LNGLLVGDGCHGKIIMYGEECPERPLLTPDCLTLDQFPPFTKDAVVQAGTEAIFATQLPDVGYFGDISLNLTIAGIEVEGTLSVAMDGLVSGGFQSNIIPFTGNTTVKIGYEAARRNHVYVFQLSNNGTQDFVIVDVQYILQDCSHIGGGGPNCEYYIPMLVLNDGVGQMEFDPSERGCYNGWCYLEVYDGGCSPILSVSGNGSGVLPSIYFKSENAPTTGDFDTAFVGAEGVTYNPMYLEKSAIVNMVGFHYHSQDPWLVNFDCGTPDPREYSPGEIAGFVVLGLFVVFLITALTIYFRKRAGYETVDSD